MTARSTRSLPLAAVLAVGALVLSSCGFTGLYGASLPGGADVGDNPYTITGYFADALDLVPQSAVKINDVAEGKVTSISLADCKVSTTTVKQWCAKVSCEARIRVFQHNLPCADIRLPEQAPERSQPVSV